MFLLLEPRCDMNGLSRTAQHSTAHHAPNEMCTLTDSFLKETHMFQHRHTSYFMTKSSLLNMLNNNKT